MQFIDLKAQYQVLQSKINTRIQSVLDHGHYIMGPEVFELETKLAEFAGVEQAVSCANGTDALQLALMALDIGPGDAVFTTPFTFFATAEVISLVGAHPVFVDVDERTFNIDPKQLEIEIQRVQAEGTYQAKAVIAVDLFGLPADYPHIEPICKRHDLRLIEDAAQGFGGEINGRRAGSFGDIATTSFFPAKPLGCYGDGGALFTNNDELAEKLKSLRVHGKGTDKYDNVRIGMNSRLDTIQAAILLEKLAVFPDELESRQQVADHYTEALEGVFKTPKIPRGYRSAWAQYTLLSEQRDSLKAHLQSHQIPSMIYYPAPLHQLGAYERLGYCVGAFPVAEQLSKQVISLPMHPYMESRSNQLVTQELFKAL
ncbi:DegT/DnrJ/EryC1/StrS family aminotransferase [Aestuariirhabdus sp. Z084]|uniref:DegT/DnrJ/EryC1/StrS family aminotransferase n=1 Tax=Aestuariirhabdus haliotis TaxID=2918751 RepID=UPI0020BE39E5|nr:DegT/DnrJ/EryC1/StrS family aminotransferase [Aestuariirhabdus haliotis]MCL6415795.1 DegT/DnrJ/EryC1/StrS family aminotransferase [Aestuariirhabdus haliotis]